MSLFIQGMKKRGREGETPPSSGSSGGEGGRRHMTVSCANTQQVPGHVLRAFPASVSLAVASDPPISWWRPVWANWGPDLERTCPLGGPGWPDTSLMAGDRAGSSGQQSVHLYRFIYFIFWLLNKPPQNVSGFKRQMFPFFTCRTEGQAQLCSWASAPLGPVTSPSCVCFWR